ncbi:unnamed protein product [Urochloa humidicola]
MASFVMKSSSQGLLLLSLLVLLAFSVTHAPISGESIIVDGGRKSKMTMDANKAAVINDDIYNGCWPHDAGASNFCCSKDNLCWPSLTECAINCPCKVRCF